MEPQSYSNDKIFALTPAQIVSELDRHIIGQTAAKRAVAIALRNRWRRQQLSAEIAKEITPRNILMIGPTGCGKTEIARRLAQLTGAPFIKVEATKFTEIGYVGRDVEQIIRDLVEEALTLIKDRQAQDLKDQAEVEAMERLVDALVGKHASMSTRTMYREKLLQGEMGDDTIEIELTAVARPPMVEIPGLGGGQGMIAMGDILGKMMGNNKKMRKISIKKAWPLLVREEIDKRRDHEADVETAIHMVEQNGIVFLDEMDKIAGDSAIRGEVSREGVQRDLLPLIEGTTVSTRYGSVKTNHILFIASGAFHMNKPSDLLPELQGRLPIRVTLDPLDEESMRRILVEPDYALTRQYQELLGSETLEITFTEDAIAALASIAVKVNSAVENIGARRLQTLMELLLEDISFSSVRTTEDLAPVVIDAQMVHARLSDVADNTEVGRFII